MTPIWSCRRSRPSRSEFWFGALAGGLAWFAVSGPIGFATMVIANGGEAEGLDPVAVSIGLWMLFCSTFAWPVSMLGVRRFHDRGHSGWPVCVFLLWIALVRVAFSVVPLLNDSSSMHGLWLLKSVLAPLNGAMLFALVVCYCLPSKMAANRFGPVPNLAPAAPPPEDGPAHDAKEEK